jgi:hypothetical protein
VPSFPQRNPSQHGLAYPQRAPNVPQQMFAVVPWEVVTSPQVSPEQHSLSPVPPAHAYPRIVQHSPCTQERFLPLQH